MIYLQKIHYKINVAFSDIGDKYSDPLFNFFDIVVYDNDNGT